MRSIALLAAGRVIAMVSVLTAGCAAETEDGDADDGDSAVSAASSVVITKNCPSVDDVLPADQPTVTFKVDSVYWKAFQTSGIIDLGIASKGKIVVRRRTLGGPPQETTVGSIDTVRALPPDSRSGELFFSVPRSDYLKTRIDLDFSQAAKRALTPAEKARLNDFYEVRVLIPGWRGPDTAHRSCYPRPSAYGD